MHWLDLEKKKCCHLRRKSENLFLKVIMIKNYNFIKLLYLRKMVKEKK